MFDSLKGLIYNKDACKYHILFNSKINKQEETTFTRVSSWKEIKEIVVYNLLGQKIKQYHSAVNTIDISDIANGIYVINITTDKGVTTKKFIKE